MVRRSCADGAATAKALTRSSLREPSFAEEEQATAKAFTQRALREPSFAKEEQATANAEDAEDAEVRGGARRKGKSRSSGFELS